MAVGSGHNEDYSCSEVPATLVQAMFRMLRLGPLSAVLQQNGTSNHATANELTAICTWQSQVCAHKQLEVVGGWQLVAAGGWR